MAKTLLGNFQIYSVVGTPTCSVNNAIAGSGATATISGNCQAGVITVNTTSPIAAVGVLVTVNFPSAFSTPPAVFLQDINKNLRYDLNSEEGVIGGFTVESTVNGFSIKVTGFSYYTPELMYNTQYKWFYTIVETS